MEENIVLLAGDARARALLHLLHRRGKSAVHLSACRSTDALKAEIANAQTVVLPIPVSRDGVHLFGSGEACILVSDVLSALQKGQRVFGGGFSEAICEAIEEAGATAVDFLKDEAFVLKNAAFTAQGALRLLLEHTGEPLQNLPVLVTGYGRVGKATATLLKDVGCRVTVAARNEAQRTEARLSGCDAVGLSSLPPQTAAVFNTVPARIFSAQTLSRFSAGTLFIELASAPFGAAQEDVRALGLHHIPAGALPGKFCAAGCAKAMLVLLKSDAATGR